MKAIVLSWNQARVDVVETCSLASAGELSVLFTCGTRARWSSTTRAGLRAQFTALSQHFARVSVETIGYTFYRHYIFCFYNGVWDFVDLCLSLLFGVVVCVCCCV